MFGRNSLLAYNPQGKLRPFITAIDKAANMLGVGLPTATGIKAREFNDGVLAEIGYYDDTTGMYSPLNDQGLVIDSNANQIDPEAFIDAVEAQLTDLVPAYSVSKLNKRARILQEEQTIINLITIASDEKIVDDDVKEKAFELIESLINKTARNENYPINKIWRQNFSSAGKILTATSEADRYEAIASFLEKVSKGNGENFVEQLQKFFDRTRKSFKFSVGSAVQGRLQKLIMEFLQNPEKLDDNNHPISSDLGTVSKLTRSMGSIFMTHVPKKYRGLEIIKRAEKVISAINDVNSDVDIDDLSPEDRKRSLKVAQKDFTDYLGRQIGSLMDIKFQYEDYLHLRGEISNHYKEGATLTLPTEFLNTDDKRKVMKANRKGFEELITKDAAVFANSEMFSNLVTNNPSMMCKLMKDHLTRNEKINILSKLDSAISSAVTDASLNSFIDLLMSNNNTAFQLAHAFGTEPNSPELFQRLVKNMTENEYELVVDQFSDHSDNSQLDTMLNSYAATNSLKGFNVKLNKSHYQRADQLIRNLNDIENKLIEEFETSKMALNKTFEKLGIPDDDDNTLNGIRNLFLSRLYKTSSDSGDDLLSSNPILEMFDFDKLNILDSNNLSDRIDDILASPDLHESLPPHLLTVIKRLHAYKSDLPQKIKNQRTYIAELKLQQRKHSSDFYSHINKIIKAENIVEPSTRESLIAAIGKLNAGADNQAASAAIESLQEGSISKKPAGIEAGLLKVFQAPSLPATPANDAYKQLKNLAASRGPDSAAKTVLDFIDSPIVATGATATTEFQKVMALGEKKLEKLLTEDMVGHIKSMAEQDDRDDLLKNQICKYYLGIESLKFDFANALIIEAKLMKEQSRPILGRINQGLSDNGFVSFTDVELEQIITNYDSARQINDQISTAGKDLKRLEAENAPESEILNETLAQQLESSAQIAAESVKKIAHSFCHTSAYHDGTMNQIGDVVKEQLVTWQEGEDDDNYPNDIMKEKFAKILNDFLALISGMFRGQISSL